MLRTFIGAAAAILAVTLSAAQADDAPQQGQPIQESPIPASQDAAAQSPPTGETSATGETKEPIIVTAHGLPPGSRQIVTTYEGSWNGIDALNIAIAATITPRSYAAVAKLSPDGLTEMTKRLRANTTFDARASGDMKGWGAPAPVDYFHKGGTKGRVVEVSFAPKAVTTRAMPKFGNYGDPPATPAQRLEAVDPLSAAIAMVSAEGEHVCEQTIKIFDGKARYDLQLSPAGSEKISVGGYKGPAIKCNARYLRVAGYDKPKKGEKSLVDKPFAIWFAPAENGLQVPARIRIQSNYGPINVKLQSVKATTIS